MSWLRRLLGGGKRDGNGADAPGATDEPAPSPSGAVLDLRKKKNAVAIPRGTTARRIIATGCANLSEIPPGLSCSTLELGGTAVRTLPDDLKVSTRIDLTDCKRLESLPTGLVTGSLVLSGCTALRRLPAGLTVSFLDMRGCTSLEAIPDDLIVRGGRLSLRDCRGVRSIPATIGPVAQLDLAGCSAIASLPDTLAVTSWIDIAGTGVTRLPEGSAGIQVRWRSVLIDERIAFHPERLTAGEILNERNAERRRVMLERFGFERFMADAEALVLDTDTDAGGERRLLRVSLPDDEDLVCVSVICPSTDRRYLIRVPPTMQTCRQAVAWTAGFDDPDDYRPQIET